MKRGERLAQAQAAMKQRWAAVPSVSTQPVCPAVPPATSAVQPTGSAFVLYVCSCTATFGDKPEKCPNCDGYSRPYPDDEYRDDEEDSPAVPSVLASNILSAEQWLELPTETEEKHIVFGSKEQATVRTRTKNIIQAPQKSFKTTFGMRTMLALSCGETVYHQLPVLKARKALYVHGELSPQEIKERTQAAARGLPRPLDNFFQMRDLQIDLIHSSGQGQLRRILDKVQPDDLVLDPYQSFITGHDENEFREISQATRFIDRLIEEYGLTFYLVTHTGKDTTRGTRGHSVIEGWRDTLIKLERKKDLVTVTIEPRWAAPIEGFNLTFDGGILVTTGASPFTKQAQSIRDVIKANGGKASRQDVGAALGLEGDALRQAINRAQKSGAIKVEGEEITCDSVTVTVP